MFTVEEERSRGWDCHRERNVSTQSWPDRISALFLSLLYILNRTKQLIPKDRNKEVARDPEFAFRSEIARVVTRN